MFHDVSIWGGALVFHDVSLQLLKTLNSNSENPYLIWDNRTRAELTKYLEEQQQSMIRTVCTPCGVRTVCSLCGVTLLG